MHFKSYCYLARVNVGEVSTERPYQVIFICRLYFALYKIFTGKINCTMIWAGHVARMGEERGAYRVLVGKPEGRRTTVET